MRDGIVAGSFRDPSAFVFRYAGDVYRQVNASSLGDLDRLETSGLYRELVDAELLLEHEYVDVPSPAPAANSRIIRPEQVHFVSYPYEWCFGQLKDAALATLEIQLRALPHGMSLKDASAFNIQFLSGRPKLIDTLSLERYREGRPWVAYAQFCEHFLGPLLLMSRVDPRLGRICAITADGVPLEVVSRMLPWTTRLMPGILLHVHLHARSIAGFGARALPSSLESRGLSRRGMENLIESLTAFVRRIEWAPQNTEWAEYERDHGYAETSQRAKREAVSDLLKAIQPATVWDIGANTGEYSRIASGLGAKVISIDSDPAAVERNYRRMRNGGERSIHPLYADVRAPSPSLGWAQSERDGLTERSTADVVLALALVHHIAIGGNVPFGRIAEWLSKLAPHVVIEFVPKEDPQVQRLLTSREDVFDDYSRESFERAMGQRFDVRSVRELPGSGRVIFHGVRRGI